MDVFTAINKRRSIRKFAATPIPRADLERIIAAGSQAPSAKNRQPWRFVAVAGGAKDGMLAALQKGLERERRAPTLPASGNFLAGARNTLAVMRQAPVTVFVLNPLNTMTAFPRDWEERLAEVANLQSVGACLQNMLLAALDLGYGSLWNCDIYFAYAEIADWLATRAQIVAAVSFGLAAEQPYARPRNPLGELLTWKT